MCIWVQQILSLLCWYAFQNKVLANSTKKPEPSILLIKFHANILYAIFHLLVYVGGQVLDGGVSAFLEVEYVDQEAHRFFAEIVTHFTEILVGPEEAPRH